MHYSRLCGFVIDCENADIDAAAAFWSKALGRAVNPPHEGFDAYRDLKSEPPDPMMILQRVDHPSRVHLDIESTNLEAEAARLEKLGAKRIGFVKRWIVMEAPTGHRFCVVNPQRGAKLTDDNSNRWE